MDRIDLGKAFLQPQLGMALQGASFVNLCRYFPDVLPVRSEPGTDRCADETKSTRGQPADIKVAGRA